MSLPQEPSSQIDTSARDEASSYRPTLPKKDVEGTEHRHDGPQDVFQGSKTVSLKENNMDTPTHQSLYATGLEMRKRVVGEDYVADALEKGQSDFLRPLQQFATVSSALFSQSFPYNYNWKKVESKNLQKQESAWGTIWTRPGLDLRTRSLLNLVMLTALGKWTELGTHVRGAVRNGVTEVEIREALLQARSVFPSRTRKRFVERN